MGKLEKLGVASAADRQARIDLAAAFRLAVRMDLHEGVCNHFTLMLPDGKRFLLNAYGLHWSETDKKIYPPSAARRSTTCPLPRFPSRLPRRTMALMSRPEPLLVKEPMGMLSAPS